MSVDVPASTPLTTDPAATRDSWLWLSPRGLAVLFLVWLLSRWIFDAMWNLVPDEAYYWVWSRHPAASYLDHPPVVAYLIRLGTAILGSTELGVRWLVGLTTGGTVLVLTLAARRLTGDRRAAAFVPIALLVSPMVAVTGSIVTPDAPACFFQAMALAAVLRIFDAGQRAALNWLAFGAFMGLALDSKYTSILLGLALLLALVSCSEGRRQLLTPWPWLAAMVAAAVFSPVLFWNARHGWALFRFQLHHGVVGGDSPAWKNLLDYAGGQAAICTPVMLLVCLAGLIIYWRRRNNPMPVRILLLAATTPLVFFAVSAVRRRPEVNWPMFAYFPAVMLYARYLGESWGKAGGGPEKRGPRRRSSSPWSSPLSCTLRSLYGSCPRICQARNGTTCSAGASWRNAELNRCGLIQRSSRRITNTPLNCRSIFRRNPRFGRWPIRRVRRHLIFSAMNPRRGPGRG